MADVKISELPTKTIASTDIVPVVDAALTTTSRVTAGAIAGLVTSAGQLTTGTLPDARLSANVVLTSDSRLSDARTPTAHKSSHATGGSDALSAADIGAASASHSHAASDITSGTLATARLGSGTASSANFLRGDGAWSSIPLPSRTAQSVTSSTQTLSITDVYAGVLTSTLSSNVTLALPAASNGAAFTLILKQDATGGRVATFANVSWPTGSAPTLATSSNSFVVLGFWSDSASWYGTLLSPASVSSTSSNASLWSL